MHKISHTPELLDEILSYSSEHTKTIASRVCRLWFAHSVPPIWNTVQINDALEVLSPFVSIHEDRGFEEPLEPQSWDRFFIYSKHVRHLQCWAIEYKALRQAALWRPSGEFFFPKLTILEGGIIEENHIECLPLLLTPTLQVLRIELGHIKNPGTLDVLYKTIPIRSPSLNVFRLQFIPTYDREHFVPLSLIQLLVLLPRLISFAIPVWCMTQEIFQILSRSHFLEDITSLRSGCHLDDLDSEALPKLKTRNYQEETGEQDLSFRFLSKLEICDGEQSSNEIFTMIKALEDGIRFHNVVELVYCVHQQNLAQISNSMKTVHIVCPRLRKVTINRENTSLYVTRAYLVPWNVIQILFKCPALVELTLSGTICIGNLEPENIVTVTTNRLSWKVLNLPSSKPLSYEALFVFAQNCPDLVELGLTLDSKLEFPDLSTLTADIKFPSLTLLNVGSSASALTCESKVARFLSSICGKPLKITTYEANSSAAANVEEMMSCITMMQLDNRRLKNEIAALKAEKNVSS